MKLKKLPSGEIRFEGITYPGITALNKRITFNPKKWFDHWESNIQDIEKSKFTYNQITHIHKSYIHDILTYGGLKQMIKQHQKVNELNNKLVIAFNQSYSNYRESKNGLFGFVMGLFANKMIDKLKIPQLPLKK